MDIVHPEIESYLESLFPSGNPVLRQMEKLAQKERFPIVGPLVGRLLSLAAGTIGAERVYEFGSGFGYSALWFAWGMMGNRELILTDDDEENARMAREFLSRGCPEARVLTEVGDAISIIDRYMTPFDIVFIDCDKKRYPQALEKAIPKVRKGGLIIADNVLWSGTVIRPSEDPSVVGIQTFNRMLSARSDLETTFIPLRDGVSISLKH